MLKLILNLEGVKKLSNTEKLGVSGGISSCMLECMQALVDCREDGHSHCSASFQVCKSTC